MFCWQPETDFTSRRARTPAHTMRMSQQRAPPRRAAVGHSAPRSSHNKLIDLPSACGGYERRSAGRRWRELGDVFQFAQLRACARRIAVYMLPVNVHLFRIQRAGARSHFYAEFMELPERNDCTQALYQYRIYMLGAGECRIMCAECCGDRADVNRRYSLNNII